MAFFQYATNLVADDLILAINSEVDFVRFRGPPLLSEGTVAVQAWALGFSSLPLACFLSLALGRLASGFVLGQQ